MSYEALAVRNSRNELHIETRIDLPGIVASEGRKENRPGETKLAITTGKNGGGKLVSRASVSFYGEQFVVHAFGMGTGRGDYSAKIIEKPGRATEKALRSLHDEALTYVPVILEQIKAFYAAQEKVAA